MGIRRGRGVTLPYEHLKECTILRRRQEGIEKRKTVISGEPGDNIPLTVSYSLITLPLTVYNINTARVLDQQNV
jgi:hypothetical protein